MWDQKICLMAKTLYEIIMSMRRRRKRTTRSDYHQPYTKNPLMSCHIYSTMTTKHSCQRYTVDLCKTQQKMSWWWEIQCGSMIKMNHDKCNHQTYIVELQQDNDNSHDQVHYGSMMRYTYVSDIHNSHHSLGGEVIIVKSPNIPGSSKSLNRCIASHVNKWSWSRTWKKSTD